MRCWKFDSSSWPTRVSGESTRMPGFPSHSATPPQERVRSRKIDVKYEPQNQDIRGAAFASESGKSGNADNQDCHSACPPSMNSKAQPLRRQSTRACSLRLCPTPSHKPMLQSIEAPGNDLPFFASIKVDRPGTVSTALSKMKLPFSCLDDLSYQLLWFRPKSKPRCVAVVVVLVFSTCQLRCKLWNKLGGWCSLLLEKLPNKGRKWWNH